MTSISTSQSSSSSSPSSSSRPPTLAFKPVALLTGRTVSINPVAPRPSSFPSLSSFSSLSSSSSQPPPSAFPPGASLTGDSVGIKPVFVSAPSLLSSSSSSLSSLSSTSSSSSSSSQPLIERDPWLKAVFDIRSSDAAKIVTTDHVRAIFRARKVFSINIGNANNHGFGYQMALMDNLFYKTHKLSGGENPGCLQPVFYHSVVKTLQTGGEDSPWQVYRNPNLLYPIWNNIGFSIVWSPGHNQVIIGEIDETYGFFERFWWTHDQGIALTSERVREIFNSWGGLKSIGLDPSLPGFDVWRTYKSPSLETLQKENNAFRLENKRS